MRIALSGTGRIGRLCIRRAFRDGPIPGVEWAAINSTCPIPVLAHLLQYDSVHGHWEADIRAEEGHIVINGCRIPVVSERDPGLLPWKNLGVDLVIDATGKFADRPSMSKHLSSGARFVILTYPSKEADLTVVMGVNQDRFDPGLHRLVSAASCTTNCLAPVLYILDRAFGVKSGWMTTIHAYTSDQRLLDNPHRDLRRARAAASSIVPTTTGVSRALADVLPGLAPHIAGISVRVPTQDVSLLDLQVVLNRPVEPEDVEAAFRKAIAEDMGPYVEYTKLPLVSADFIGNEKSAVVDGLSVMTRGNEAKLLAWYDNEWAYSCRVMDLVRHIAQTESKAAEGGETWLSRTR
ncbi:MAG TPA: type I glyceraldehyde-3-phosphate dehydrogenase [Paenibacillaceae bacterium]